MRPRSLFASLLVVATPSFWGCIGDDDATPAFDAGGRDARVNDAAAPLDASHPDATVPKDATLPDDAGADVAPPDVSAPDAPADVALDAPPDVAPDAPIDATPDAPIDAAPDAAPVVGERVSPAVCPWGVAIGSAQVYWTEVSFQSGCAAPAVRRCAFSGCAAVPTPIYSGTGGVTSPLGIAVVPSAGDTVFYSDNQVPNDDLWKMNGDGTGRVAWGAQIAGPAGVTRDATDLFWGNSGGLYRTPIVSGTTPAGATAVMTGGLSGAVDNAPQSIAVDATYVFAAPGGNAVVRCAKGGTCTGATAPVTIANGAAVRGITSDGTNVFITDGMTSFTPGGKERLLRCPVAGCATPSAPEVLAEITPAASGGGTHYGVATDAQNVYWGTIEGTIYYCPKTAVAPCTPTPVVTGVKPYGFAVDSIYLYWADARGGIYRVVRPVAT